MKLEKLNWKDSEEVSINFNVTSAIIEDAGTLNFYADKYIITKYPIKTGNLVEFEGFKYLIVSQIDRNKNNYRARIRQADHVIQLLTGTEREIIGYDDFGRPVFGEEVPIYENVNCIIEQGTIKVETGVINIPYNEIQVTLQDNEGTESISINDEFELFNKSWRVMGIDYTKIGLIVLHCEMV